MKEYINKNINFKILKRDRFLRETFYITRDLI